MISQMKKFLCLLSLALAGECFGTLFSYNSGFQNGGVIPDGDSGGWSDTRTVSGLDNSIYRVEVSLNISGGYNGDLYAYLGYGNIKVVLLNRVGVGTQPGTDAMGYGNAGFNVTLANGGANGDIHLYGGGGIPTGTYAPDGRVVDPLATPSAFNALGTVDFSVFNGLNPNGNWTLYVSDVVGGGGSPTLNNWSMDISAVPEPTNVALGVFAGAAVLVGLWRSKFRRDINRNPKQR